MPWWLPQQNSWGVGRHRELLHPCPCGWSALYCGHLPVPTWMNPRALDLAHNAWEPRPQPHEGQVCSGLRNRPATEQRRGPAQGQGSLHPWDHMGKDSGCACCRPPPSPPPEGSTSESGLFIKIMVKTIGCLWGRGAGRACLRAFSPSSAVLSSCWPHSAGGWGSWRPKTILPFCVAATCPRLPFWRAPSDAAFCQQPPQGTQE